MDKLLHHGEHHDNKHGESQGKKTSETECKPDESSSGEQKKKSEGKWHKFQHYLEEEHQREMDDNIWSGYRGPGH